MDNIETFDKLKTKVLKYVLYKKRSEAEVRQKFSENNNDDMLDEVIEDLKENGYINDDIYIEKTINEYQRLNNLSLRELEYKLLSKGVDKYKLEDYIENHQEELLEYELNSARNIYIKKQTIMVEEDIINYLRKKGYKSETIKRVNME